jgi:cbb3-type cytochrome oxidase subunit 3
VQAGHFLVALSILALVTYATVRTFPVPSAVTVRRGTVAAGFLVVAGYLFSYGSPLTYDAWTQSAYYALTLALFGLLLATAWWARAGPEGHQQEWLPRAVAPLAGIGATLTGVLALLGRRLTGTVPPVAADAVTLAVFALVLASIWLAYRGDRPGSVAPTAGDSD